MSRFAGLMLVLIVLACGCSHQPEAPLDPTSQALEHLQAHEYDQAIQAASQAIQQSPNDAAPYLYRGRAYYYRAAMGDPHRAIADLSEAIRLAPESSDAYYVRALLYRELGQADLAEKDDTQARQFDRVAREVFDQIPGSTTPLDVSKLKPLAADGKEAPPAKTAAEMYKENAGAAATAKSEVRPADTTLEGFVSDTESEVPAPIESDFNKQYRALLGQGMPGEDSALSTDTPAKDVFGRPLERTAPTASLDTSADGAAALPSGGATARPARGAGTWTGAVPQMQSPFSRPTPMVGSSPGLGATPGMLPTTQSPFPQAARRGTGFSPPVSPFGGAGGQASGAAGVSRPFSTPGTPFSAPSSTARPQNSDVRLPNPREYLP